MSSPSPNTRLASDAKNNRNGDGNSDGPLQSSWEGGIPEAALPEPNSTASQPDMPVPTSTMATTSASDDSRNRQTETDSSSGSVHDEYYWELDDELSRILDGQLNEGLTGTLPAMPAPMSMPEPSIPNHASNRNEAPLHLQYPQQPEEIPRPWEEWQAQDTRVRPFAPIGQPSGGSFSRPTYARDAPYRSQTLPVYLGEKPQTITPSPPPMPVADAAPAPDPAFPEPRFPLHEESEPDLRAKFNTPPSFPDVVRMPVIEHTFAKIPPPPKTPPPVPFSYNKPPSAASSTTSIHNSMIGAFPNPPPMPTTPPYSGTTSPVHAHLPYKPSYSPPSTLSIHSSPSRPNSKPSTPLSNLYGGAAQKPQTPPATPPNTGSAYGGNSKPPTPQKPAWTNNPRPFAATQFAPTQPVPQLPSTGTEGSTDTQTSPAAHGRPSKPFSVTNQPSGTSTNAGSSVPSIQIQTATLPPSKPPSHRPENLRPPNQQGSIRPPSAGSVTASSQSHQQASSPSSTMYKPPQSNLDSSSLALHKPVAQPQAKPPSIKSSKPTLPPARPSPSPSPAPAPIRPEASANTSSTISGGAGQTRYVNMLLALDDIPNWFNLLASFFTWILLAGFLLFPGTFTSLQEQAQSSNNEVQQQILKVVSHVPLFVIAWLCCGVGVVGMIWLWWRWSANYVWLLSKIFVPGFLNGLAGVITTLVNIYGVQGGQLSTTAKSTIIVVSVVAGILLILVLFYQFWLLRRVRAEHDRQMGEQAAGRHGEGILKSLVQSKNSHKRKGSA